MSGRLKEVYETEMLAKQSKKHDVSSSGSNELLCADADIKRIILDLHKKTRSNPEMWGTDGICLNIGALLNKCLHT